MSFVCSIMAIDLAIKGDVVAAVIAFTVGAMVDAIIIDALETSATKGGEE